MELPKELKPAAVESVVWSTDEPEPKVERFSHELRIGNTSGVLG